jgi:hypothetical protein
MADSTVASLEVAFNVNVAQLKAALASARGAFKGIEGAAKNLGKELGGTASATDGANVSNDRFSKMGIRTTKAIQGEIAKLDELEGALQDDEIAMRQVIQRKQQLQAELGNSSQGFDKMGAANHRANLFMINFSRGMEDLKFGLPAVINNLDGIALGFEAMAEASDAAGKTNREVLMQSLTSPAGMLAIMNVIITAAYLIGPALARSFKKGKVGAKELKAAVGDLLKSPASSERGGFFSPSSIASAKAMEEAMSKQAKVLKGEIAPAMSWSNQLGQMGAVLAKDMVGLLGEEEEQLLTNFRVYKSLRDEAEKLSVSIKAAELASAVMAKHLQSTRPEGSINALNHEMSVFREQIEAMPNAIDRLSESGGEISKQLYFAKSNENAREYIDTLFTLGGSLERLRAEVSFNRAEFERFGSVLIDNEQVAKIAGDEFRLSMIDAFNDATIALKNFRKEQTLALSETAVGGFMDGLFGNFKKADADAARLAIIGMNKEFGTLEESLAKGDMGYEEFVIRNKMRMDEMKEAQKQLALATRTNFELMADRIGNAFEGLKDSVIGAFKEIADAYVKLLVRRGVVKILGNILAPGAGTVDISGSVGGSVFDLGSNFASRTISIRSVATVIPSGDLQISVQQAGVINSRKGV